MFNPTNDGARVNTQHNREVTTLEELKKLLGYRGRSGSRGGSTTSADGSVNGGYSDATIDAYLTRFLRAKHLSTSEALAKLKRRRVFETTLPTISITPAVISILRSGAFSLLGKDIKGRPVLFLNLKDFTLPPVEVDGAQRILILLLEFMQSKCMAGGARAADASQQPPQSFVFLVDEEGAPWSVHLPLLRKAVALYSLYAKYYPGLIDLVLIAEADFEVRQGIQAALAGSGTETSRTVMMVQRNDLSRYLSPDVTPTVLGGKLQTNGNALNFAEAVLRHWYTVTSFIQLENNTSTTTSSNPAGASAGGGGGGGARPLYLPTPLISSATQFVSLHNTAVMAASAAAAVALRRKGSSGSGGGSERDVTDGPLGLAAGSRRQSNSYFSISGVGAPNDLHSQLSNSGRALGTNALEDGVCSELSVDDVTLFDDDDGGDGGGGGGDGGLEGKAERGAQKSGKARGAGSRGNTPVRPLGNEETAKVRRDPEYAVAALERERDLRIRAEQQLKIAELGVSLDPQNISSVERHLASIHNEVNVLVADIVLRARAARKKGSEATVSQLLDLTLTALETATAVPEEVPAMSMAVPQQREPDSSSCCSVM